MSKKQKNVLWRIIASAVLIVCLSVLGKFITLNKYIWLVLNLIPYFIIGYDILKKAVKGIFKGQVFDENFLMAVATVGAIALGDYKEGVAVMLFYQIGELFQSIAVGKSRRNISALMDIRPDYANVEVDGKLEKVDPDEVAVGTEITVNPGEKIPIDGVVTSGDTSLNTSALTGESLPRNVKTGDEVISGCINILEVNIFSLEFLLKTFLQLFISILIYFRTHRNPRRDFPVRYAFSGNITVHPKILIAGEPYNERNYDDGYCSAPSSEFYFLIWRFYCFFMI